MLNIDLGSNPADTSIEITHKIVDTFKSKDEVNIIITGSLSECMDYLIQMNGKQPNLQLLPIEDKEL